MKMHSNRRRGQYGIGLLAYQLFGVIGIDKIPPVTLGIVGLHSAIYLRLFQLPWKKTSHVCISVYNVWYRKEYMRLLYGAFEHADDWHLYYNMVSFVVKGQALERIFGSLKFLYLTAAFTALTSMTLVGLNLLAVEFDYDQVGNQCAVGFSGVIFALKVLTSYYNPNYTHQIMGIPIIIPARYAIWIELVLIQILVPNVSFLGHLAGILVGLAYVKGPLGPVLDTIYSIATSSFGISPRRFVPRSEPSGYRNERTQQHFPQYAPNNMSEEEQLRRATEESLRQNHNDQFYNSGTTYSGSNIYPDLDEVRARRLARYQ